VKESTFLFGAGSGLVGTLTQPQVTALSRRGFAVILFNAGIVPRLGPNRLNVRLARALAESGFPVLRFDLSGRGDSAPARGMESFEKQAVIDLRAAMDALAQRSGAHRFLIMGICSGAENAYHTALVDERIVGLSLLDPYHYPTLRTHLIRYKHRAKVHGGVVKASLSWLWLRMLPWLGRKQPEKDWAEPDFGSIRPKAEDYAARLRQLLDRGVAIDILYSGSFIETYNYANQFADVFGRFGLLKKLTCEFRPDIDHTISSPAMQREAIARTRDWFDRVHRQLQSGSVSGRPAA
jgi:pimeloyl-ACP methyl ester carboxylesterase